MVRAPCKPFPQAARSESSCVADLARRQLDNSARGATRFDRAAALLPAKVDRAQVSASNVCYSPFWCCALSCLMCMFRTSSNRFLGARRQRSWRWRESVYDDLRCVCKRRDVLGGGERCRFNFSVDYSRSFSDFSSQAKSTAAALRLCLKVMQNQLYYEIKK